MPNPFFKVVAKTPEHEAMAELCQRLLDRVQDSDEFRDMVRIPRVGREPDYINGRWCIRCHNSLPEDWGIKPCDVCGAETGLPAGALDGLLADGDGYEGIQRAERDTVKPAQETR